MKSSDFYLEANAALPFATDFGAILDILDGVVVREFLETVPFLAAGFFRAEADFPGTVVEAPFFALSGLETAAGFVAAGTALAFLRPPMAPPFLGAIFLRLVVVVPVFFLGCIII